jgi:outer membrane murein-binding lipoprotein Lpp
MLAMPLRNPVLLVTCLAALACRSTHDQPSATETGSDAFFVGSGSTDQHGHATPHDEDLQTQVNELRDSVSRLESTVGHLRSEIDASSSDNELTTMTIDSLHGEQTVSHDERSLLCHPAEWRGYGKMLRFLRLTDRVFYFEAEGHPTLQGEMAVGGMCTSDGSTRYTFLQLPSDLESGVSYRVRPRNENKQYRWAMAADLTVRAQ